VTVNTHIFLFGLIINLSNHSQVWKFQKENNVHIHVADVVLALRT
jgi:hypothetical protein